ncbi:MAG: hypothetical protein H8M99_08630 [Gloeobacteraceae cyanobacterium ES-bin-144]|nr:hypothetical protein [Verrucomicrobiales bacterium]
MTANPLYFSSFAKEVGHDLESLIRATFPNVREIHAGRLALAKLLLEGKLKSSEREVMLMDLWQSFALQAEVGDAKAGMHIGGRGGWAILITLVVTLILGFSTIWLSPDLQGAAFLLMSVFLVVGLVYAIIQVALEPGRLKRRITESLAQLLKPFEMSREEVVTCLDRLKLAGYKLGKKINPDALMSEISSANTAPPLLRTW